MAARKKLPARALCPTEHQEQAAFFEWWRLWARDLPYLAFAIPNGGARSAVTGAMLKREGVTKGIPDVFIAWPRSGKAGLFLEFKRQASGVVSDAQKAVLSTLAASGYECHVVRGWNEARLAVERYAGVGDGMRGKMF